MSIRKLLCWLARVFAVACALSLGVASADAAPPAPKQAQQRADAVSNNNWTNLYPDLYAVSAVSSSEAWAVGEYGHVVHYANGAWTDVDPALMHGLKLSDVDILADGTGWVAAGEHAFAYDGRHWVDRSIGLSSTFSLDRIGVGAPDSVWAVTHQGNLAKWDGASWQPVALDVPITYTLHLFDVAMNGPNDGWAVGVSRDSYNYESSSIYHFNGQSWSVPQDKPVSVRSWWRVAVAADGSGGVVLTGQDSYGSAGNIMVAYRITGGWDSLTLPGNSHDAPVSAPLLSELTISVSQEASIKRIDYRDWIQDYDDDLAGNINDIDGSGPSVAWAVGPADTIISRQADGSWVKQRGGLGGITLNAIQSISSDEAWAVGDKGVILHFDAGQVLTYSDTLSNNLYALEMYSPTLGYAVGTGVIDKWDGISWTTVTTLTRELHDLTLTGPDSGWAVGTSSNIWRLSAGVWSPAIEDDFGPVTFEKVVMDSDSHGWAGGGTYWAYRTLVEYKDGQWKDVSDTLPYEPYIFDLLAGPRPGELYAVGQRLIGVPTTSTYYWLHRQNGVWSADMIPEQLLGLSAEAAGEVWAVGCGPAQHEVAGVRQAVELPTTVCLQDIDLIAGRGGWAVGDHGKVLQYQPLARGQRFYDVTSSNPFYSYINYVAGHGLVSGYADNTFHPFADVTRAQLTKIVTLAAGWDLANPATPTFHDVPRSDTFYQYVETAAQHNAISGYADGTFRPYNNITRGQLSKVIVLAKGWFLFSPAIPTFSDVALDNTFYQYVETAVAHDVVNGYGDGSFKPYNNATRGQIAKIVYLAVAPAQK